MHTTLQRVLAAVVVGAAGLVGAFAPAALAQPMGGDRNEPDPSAAGDRITGAPRISVPDSPLPRVFRSVLDGKPRIVTVQLAPDLWIGFDAQNAGLSKAWSGGVRFVGAVYTTVHGPQPLSKGEAFTVGPTGKVWRVALPGGSPVEASVRYRGFLRPAGKVVFQYELSVPGLSSPIAVSEEPRASGGDGLVGLDRVFTITGAPAGATVSTAVSTDFLRFDGQTLSSDGPGGAGSGDGVRWLTLNTDKPTTISARFQPAATRALRVAYFTTSMGFRHDVLPLSRERMQGLEKDNNWLRIRATDDIGELTSEALAQLDAVVFYTSGALPLETKKAVIQFVENGGGFVGIHSATDTWNESPEWAAFIGGIFDGHPWNDRVPLIITAVDHPIMKPFADSVQSVPGQPRRFFFTDEIYQFKSLGSDLNVLLKLDPNAPGTESGRSYPLAWTREQGKGRVFYMALGHRDTVWKDQRFMDTITAGLRWVTRRDER